MSVGERLYHEEQHMRQWWVWLVVLVVAASAWWPLVQQIMLGHPFGDEPMPDWGVWLVWVLIGLGLPLLLWSTRLVTEVLPKQLVIRYRPFMKRVIPVDTIREAKVRIYHPLKEYGGWGIKGWSRSNIAYNVSGDRGVQLVLDDGRKVLIGSRRPEELARVLESQR